ncbi:MAG: hypothetical protein WCP14_03985 [bacterium]
MLQNTQNTQNIQPQTVENIPEGAVELPQVQVEQAIPAVESTVVSEQLPTNIVSNNTVQQANDAVVAQATVTAVAAVSDTPRALPPVKIKDDTIELKGDDIYLREVKRVIKEDAENPEKQEEDAETIQVDYMANHFGVKMKREEDE